MPDREPVAALLKAYPSEQTLAPDVIGDCNNPFCNVAKQNIVVTEQQDELRYPIPKD